MMPLCPSCADERKKGQYLCEACWWLLRPWVRVSLRKRDNLAMPRLQQLMKQIVDGRPLEDIEVTP